MKKEKVMEIIPRFLIKTLQDISDAAAIIDENKYVYYINKKFEDLFKFKIGGKRKNRCDTLSSLNIKISAKAMASPQFLTFGYQQEIILFVYLLNKSKEQKHFYLLIARNSERKDDKSYQIKKSNPYEDEEKLGRKNSLLSLAS